jgi:ketosteroid isomerase-like protein
VIGDHADAVARSYLASFASGDPVAIAAHVAPEFVNDHASALGSSCVGRDEYLNRLPQILASLPGLRYDVVSVIGHGDAVAVEYRLTATSDDHPVDIRGVMVMTVRDSLITRRTDYWDGLTFLHQTAAAPAPSPPAGFPQPI